MAKVQRLVGIDFGTSTSIVKVKRYEGDEPVGDSHVSGSVTFGNGESDSKAVTAVRLNSDGAATCGTEALDQVPGSTICQEFKMDLESPDRERRRQAMERTEDYFRYLYSWYDHQRSDLGAIDDEEHTLVSYPVKWRPETRAYLLETARNTGFRNVSGMDEPTAALYATLCRKMSEINQQGLLRARESGYMLLVDMGAGTTDLAVCRYRVKGGGPVVRVDQIENEIIAAWPMDSSAATFGGREVDRVLEEYVINYLESCGFPTENAQQAVRGTGNVSTAAKRWKETTVSKLLNDGKSVESCAFATPFMMFLPQAKPFPAFGRQEFEAMLGEKLEDFKSLVAGCLTQASRAEPELLAKKLDLVILTGGHSTWYFVEELLNGAMPGLSLPQLELVQQERSRVIRLSNPQETVALGLVYSRLPFHVATEKKEAPAAPADRAPAGIDRTIKAAKDTAAALRDTCRAVDQLGKAVVTAAGKAAKSSSAGKTAAAKWPTNNQLALCAQQFFKSSDQELMNRLNRGRLTKIRDKLDISADDAIFAAHDDTVLLSGKNGFVFCTSGIITKELMESKRLVSWLSFATGTLRPFRETTPKTDGIVFCDSLGVANHLIYWTVGFNENSIADLYRLFAELQQLMRTRFGLKEVSKQAVRTNTDGVTNEQLAQDAMEFIQSYDQNVISGITRGDPEKVSAGLEIPAEAKIYLYHDDSILMGGKEGFAITDRGFYCRPAGGDLAFTDWLTFFASALEIIPKNGGILSRCDPSHDSCEPISYFVIGRSFVNAEILIAHLHAHLRSLYA